MPARPATQRVRRSGRAFEDRRGPKCVYGNTRKMRVDFEFSSQEIDFREEVEKFVKAELPVNWDDRVMSWPGGYGTLPCMEAEFQEVARDFNRKLGAKGWLSLSWPEKYGGLRSPMKAAIAVDVFSYYRAPTTRVDTVIAAPTLILIGSEDLKNEFLPKIASGDIGFWLAYSEPNAGSDLAALKTTAVEDGDEFVINGQKIWSSGAHVTQYAWALVKTDLEAPAHKGATLIIIPNDTPGITIKPIINICGSHSFNEVFFDDVRVNKRYVVGEVNRGFYNVMLALQFERMAVGPGAFRRVLDELVGFARQNIRNGRPLSQDLAVMRSFADLAIEIEVLYGFYWQSACCLERGRVPDLETSVLKLFFTELGVKLANAAVDILGPYALLDKGSKWAPFSGRIGVGYLDAVSGPIGAGTSEIQKNILAARGLGLPRS